MKKLIALKKLHKDGKKIEAGAEFEVDENIAKVLIAKNAAKELKQETKQIQTKEK